MNFGGKWPSDAAFTALLSLAAVGVFTCIAAAFGVLVWLGSHLTWVF